MKTAIITGGSRGIGASLVADFLRSGWNVVYSGTTEQTVQKSLEKIPEEFGEERYAAFKCDVTVEDDLVSLWDNGMKAFGRIDIWINNAGIATQSIPFHEVPTDEFVKVLDTNLKGLMMATHIVYNRMAEQGFGAIYNMEGLGSDGKKIPGTTTYGTTKRAIRYFTDAFAREVKNGPVIVATIAPGMVLTDLLLDPVKRGHRRSKDLIWVYNILANDAETVTPFLVRKMIGNTRNGRKIRYLTNRMIAWKFLTSPFSRRDVVSKYLK